MTTVARWASSIHAICDFAEFRPALRALVLTAVAGITARGSLLLREILRDQVDGARELRNAEQRLSSSLKTHDAWDALPEAHLRFVAPAARGMRFRSVDGGDVSKPASRALEFLDVVRDSSCKPRDRVAVGPMGVVPASSVPERKQATRDDRKRSRRRDPGARVPWPRTARARTASRRAARSVDKAQRKEEKRASRLAEDAVRDVMCSVARCGVGLARCSSDRCSVRSAAVPTVAATVGSPGGPAGCEAGGRVGDEAGGQAEPTGEATARYKFPSPPALKKLGYWTLLVDVGDGKGNHLPLYQDLFSTLDPAYQALGEDAWSLTFLRAVDLVLKHVGRGGVWLFDRGFDDVKWMNWMKARVDQYVIRVRCNRSIHPGTPGANALQVQALAATLQPRYVAEVRYVDKSNHKAKTRKVTFNWAPIYTDGVDHGQYLVVVHTGRKRPLLLVTNHRPESAEEAAELIQGYLERWGNEETTRAEKQLVGMEGMRVRTLGAMRRLLWLSMVAVGIQAMLILTCGRLTRAILDRAKEFIADVRFVLYRVWRVVQGDVRRAIDRRSPLLRS